MRPRKVEATCLEALSVALQHPAVAADQHNICKLLQVCKACRTAVQQSTECLTDINFSKQLYCDSGEAIAAFSEEFVWFAEWLYSTAGVLRSINLDVTISPDISAELSSFRALAQQVVAFGLNTAAAAQFSWRCCNTTLPAVTTDPAKSASDTAAAQLLQLCSFSCSHEMTSTAVLSALPAATLTMLDISVPKNGQVHQAIANLSNLRNLRLQSHHSTLPEGYVSTINKLIRLTALALRTLQSTSCLPMLPRQLESLELCVDAVGGGNRQPVTLSLSHLIRLQQLTAVVCREVETAALPQQLQILDIYSHSPAVSAFNIASLKQLKQLTLYECLDSDPHEVLALREAKQLTTIELKYQDITTALAAAPAWPQLPQLAALDLLMFGGAEDAAPVLLAVSSLGRLTGLAMTAGVYEFGEPDNEDLYAAQARVRSVFQCFASLTQLRSLDLCFLKWLELEQNDMLHLSKLTCLTYLSLSLDSKLDSTIVIAMLAELLALQVLSLSGIQDACPLPIIGKLIELTCLSLYDLPREMQVIGLKYLTGLRNLQALHGFDACSNIKLAEFWADLRVA